MAHLKEYDVVRVTQLLKPDRRYDGNAGIKRPPQIGDSGTIVHVPPEPYSEWCIVECLDKNGFTIWLADFTADELELVVSAK